MKDTLIRVIILGNLPTRFERISNMSEILDKKRQARAIADASKAVFRNRAYELGLIDKERSIRAQMNQARANDDLRSYYALFEQYHMNNQEYGWMWRQAMRENASRASKTRRVKARISAMLEVGKCIFITFTFSDAVMARTTAETRRQLVYRYMKAHSDYYVGNRDYGATNGREHYHGVIRCDKLDLTKWHSGAINVRRIRATPTDQRKLAKYLTKLSMHATKDSTLTQRIIYSRKICDNKD